MSRMTVFLAGVGFSWILALGPPGTVRAADEPHDDSTNDALVEARAAMDEVKAEMRAWRNNSFELQKRLVSEDEELAELQKEIAAKEEEALRLRQAFNKRLDEHPEMVERREKRRVLAEKYKEAQDAYTALSQKRGGGEQ